MWRRILQRDASTNRRRYAQQPLHRAAFRRTCSYTERFVQRETFIHRRLYTQKSFRTVTHRSFYTRMLCTKMLLHSAAFTHRRLYTQRLLHTDAFTHRSFFTEKPSQRTAFTQRSFPPHNKKQAKRFFLVWIFFASCRFPSR